MIICCGESLIDMISVANAGNESVYAGLTGGAIFNTSIALGRLDVPVGLISGVSTCLLYTSPSPRDRQKYRMPSSA